MAATSSRRSMTDARKPRGDSKLKTLPPKRQEQIAEHALGHNLAETVAWLADDGLKTSVRALSDFLSWYQLRARLARNQTVVETLMETLRREDPHLNPDQLFSIGQNLFAGLAIESHDPDVWVGTQRLALEQRRQELARENLRLQRDRFEFDAASACLEKLPELRAIAASGLDQSAKIEQVRLKLFGELKTEA